MGRMDLCAGLLMLAFVLFAAGAVIYFAFKAFLAVLKAIFIPAAAQEPVERPRRRQQCSAAAAPFPRASRAAPSAVSIPRGRWRATCAISKRLHAASRRSRTRG